MRPACSQSLKPVLLEHQYALDNFPVFEQNPGDFLTPFAGLDDIFIPETDSSTRHRLHRPSERRRNRNLDIDVPAVSKSMFAGLSMREDRSPWTMSDVSGPLKHILLLNDIE